MQRWTGAGDVREDRRKEAPRPVPVNKLSDEERQHVLVIVNSKEFRSLPPSQYGGPHCQDKKTVDL